MTTTDKLTDEALVHRAVLDWIKEDAPIGIKMQMTPDLANKLSDRIAHRRASQAAPAPSDGLREAVPLGLVEALRSGRQADMDGVMVTVSRQACEMAADILSALTPAPAQEVKP